MTTQNSTAPQQIIGRQHKGNCHCGCHFAAGERGTLVIDSDTPKLAEMGLAYYAFDGNVVCYTLEEAAAYKLPDLDVIPGRKYLKVAEWLGSRDDGQRTVRWFKDTQTGTWYVAESWRRPNLRRPLNAEQTAYVESVVNS
jgi:hypothetical protein